MPVGKVLQEGDVGGDDLKRLAHGFDQRLDRVEDRQHDVFEEGPKVQRHVPQDDGRQVAEADVLIARRHRGVDELPVHIQHGGDGGQGAGAEIGGERKRDIGVAGQEDVQEIL